jgi:menaquinone-dependent protoporphyrinogen IX oxidase
MARVSAAFVYICLVYSLLQAVRLVLQSTSQSIQLNKRWRKKKKYLHFVLVQQHVRNAVSYRIRAIAVRADKFSFFDVQLVNVRFWQARGKEREREIHRAANCEDSGGKLRLPRR